MLPILYLDSGIIRSFIEKKPPVLVNLFRTIKDRKWQCFTSTFGILELSNLKKDDVYLRKGVSNKLEYKEIIKGRDQKNLSSAELKEVRKYIRTFLKKYPHFSFIDIPQEVWKSALEITLNTNIHSIDAVHLACAIYFGANLLVTNDGHFIRESDSLLKNHKLADRIRVVLPEKVFEALSEIGFNLEE